MLDHASRGIEGLPSLAPIGIVPRGRLTGDRMSKSIRAAFLSALLALVMVVGPFGRAPAQASDQNQVGYYYPPPQTHEVYHSRAVTLPDSDRDRRLGFVTAMTQQMLNNPYPPTYAIFAKGDGAEKLIIVSLSDDGYNTLYRARALFAILTATARLTPFFQQHAVEDVFTFFDLCKLLGFTQITWSDGKTLAHQIVIK